MRAGPEAKDRLEIAGLDSDSSDTVAPAGV